MMEYETVPHTEEQHKSVHLTLQRLNMHLTLDFYHHLTVSPPYLQLDGATGYQQRTIISCYVLEFMLRVILDIICFHLVDCLKLELT